MKYIIKVTTPVSVGYHGRKYMLIQGRRNVALVDKSKAARYSTAWRATGAAVHLKRNCENIKECEIERIDEE